ncbi:MAG TPA: hypothetical protein VGG41_15685 [Solirubrobacteraceae bacterium]|jgi:hypothetical protein
MRTRARSRFSAGLIAVLATVLLGLPDAGSAKGVACAHALKEIDQGANGPIACVHSGVPQILAEAGTPLALKTITLTVLSERAGHNISDTLPPFPDSVDVVLSVQISNDTTISRQFSEVDLTELEVGDDEYTVDYGGTHDQAAVRLGENPYIAPGKSLRGDLIFTIHHSDLKSAFPAHAGLAFINFGQSTASGSVSQIGIIALGRGGL